MSAWGKRTAAGIAWSSAAFISGKAATFLATLVLARILVPAEFGVVAGVLVFLSFIELGSDLGLKWAVVYEQEEGITPRVRGAMTTNLIVATLIALGAMALAPPVADLLNASGHDNLFRLIAVNVVITALGNIQDGILLREMDFSRRTRAMILRAIVRAIVSIGLAFAGFGAASLVVGFLAGTLAWTLALWVLVPLRPSLRIDPAAARAMLGYGGAASLLQVLTVIATRSDAIVIGHMLGVTALGLYAVAFRVPELIIENVSWNVSAVAFPALARKRAEDPRGLADGTLALLRWGSLWALPVAAGIAILATPMTVVLFGPDWKPAAGVMAAIAIMSGLHAVVFPLGDTFKALGRQRVLVAVSLVSLPLLVLSLVAAAPAGLLTVAWVRTGFAVAHCLVLLTLTAIAVGIGPGQVLRASAAGFTAAAGVAVGAGIAQAAWPEPDVLSLTGCCLCGAVWGLLFVRLFAPGRFEELGGLVGSLAPRLRGEGYRSGGSDRVAMETRSR
jgi:PST family polysaccharide transporter